jgi:hypothetical protein
MLFAACVAAHTATMTLKECHTAQREMGCERHFVRRTNASRYNFSGVHEGSRDAYRPVVGAGSAGNGEAGALLRNRIPKQDHNLARQIYRLNHVVATAREMDAHREIRAMAQRAKL